DSWDASEDEDSKPKGGATSTSSTTSPKPAPKKKSTLKEKIAERKAEEERKKAEFLAAKTKQLEIDDLYAGETAQQRKQREEQSIRDADLENAKDLFGVNDKPVQEKSFIDTMTPNNKEEFDKYIKLLLEKFRKFEKSPQFGYFVENLTRDLCVSLNVDDVKRIGSGLTVLANEKQKAAKPAAAKKKGAAKGKIAIKADTGGIDTTNYDDVYDDFDDFM
ncbi:Eukaryotic translation initiation factor 3 subunit J, partial [Blyttiomyces sp. JEL0837]